MKTVLLLSLLVAVAACLSEDEYQIAFRNFIQTYGKSYKSEEIQRRFEIFRQNLDYVNKHNAEEHSYTVSINRFADLTVEEFASKFLNPPVTVDPSALSFAPTDLNTQLPDSFDWRTKGAVTRVKNQQNCGSWSFSTTGSTEGCHFLSTKSLVSLSEQNLIDCSTPYGNHGCFGGGLMTDAMEYIIDNDGIDTEASYPYLGRDGPKCNYTVENRGATLTGYTNVKAGSEADLQQKVFSGPVSIAIDASQVSFQLYSGGIYYEPNCSSTQLDHGVLAVGWGMSNNGSDYWIVKNSWGTTWGMEGYIQMARNRNNNCGVATLATLPHC